MSDAQAGAGQHDSVGGALHEPDDKSTQVDENGQAVQTEPVLEQNIATTDEKLQGIAAQTRVDLGDESHGRYEEVIRQRLSDADIDLTDDEVTSLARRSHPSGGDSGGSGA